MIRHGGPFEPHFFFNETAECEKDNLFDVICNFFLKLKPIILKKLQFIMEKRKLYVRFTFKNYTKITYDYFCKCLKMISE